MNAIARCALGALLFVGLAACNNDDLPPASTFATLQGTVVDKATNKPIAGATVTIDTVLAVVTDASGKYVVPKVPSGIVDYTIGAQGYQLVSATTNAEPGKTVEVDVTLQASPPGH
jgi:hypothetical protein